ncbi:MAG: arabinose transporter permease [Rariglobus sp.]|jgi:LPLT family lysophospholipid transporter-like MFS transporter|nr:arabinose transporter permease [Rariglobus sp.]
MPNKRDYPLLLTGQFLGAFGDNFLLAAILGPLTFQLLAGTLTEPQVNTQNALFSAVFFVPFLALAPLAGWLNDRMPKSIWLTGGNAIKLLGALLGLAAIALHSGDLAASRPWQLAAYFIVGLGACVYSPAKYGVLPEILPPDRLVKANGTVEMLTLVAVLAGLWGGATLFDATRSLTACYAASAGLYLLALACNARMARTPSDSTATLGRSAGAFVDQLTLLMRHPRLGRVLLGCGLFWFAGAVLRGNLQSWGFEALHAAGVVAIDNQKLALLKLGLIGGVVAGSLLAGRFHAIGDLSGSRFYGTGMAAGVLALGVIGGHGGVLLAAALLAVTGLFAGLLVVPLNATLQHEGDPATRGKTIAAQNFVDYAAMLVGAAFLQLLTRFEFTSMPVFVALASAVVLPVLALRSTRPAVAA